ncbi:MAG: hypothetical protein AAFY73_07175 [Pseudomonadota bacterium]
MSDQAIENRKFAATFAQIAYACVHFGKKCFPIADPDADLADAFFYRKDNRVVRNLGFERRAYETAYIDSLHRLFMWMEKAFERGVFREQRFPNLPALRDQVRTVRNFRQHADEYVALTGPLFSGRPPSRRRYDPSRFGETEFATSAHYQQYIAFAEMSTVVDRGRYIIGGHVNFWETFRLVIEVYRLLRLTPDYQEALIDNGDPRRGNLFLLILDPKNSLHSRLSERLKHSVRSVREIRSLTMETLDVIREVANKTRRQMSDFLRTEVLCESLSVDKPELAFTSDKYEEMSGWEIGEFLHGAILVGNGVPAVIRTEDDLRELDQVMSFKAAA